MPTSHFTKRSWKGRKAAARIKPNGRRDAFRQNPIEVKEPDYLTRQLDSWLAQSAFTKI